MLNTKIKGIVRMIFCVYVHTIKVKKNNIKLASNYCTNIIISSFIKSLYGS